MSKIEKTTREEMSKSGDTRSIPTKVNGVFAKSDKTQVTSDNPQNIKHIEISSSGGGATSSAYILTNCEVYMLSESNLFDLCQESAIEKALMRGTTEGSEEKLLNG